MAAPAIAPDRGQRRSLAVRNWHREVLDGWAKAYDLDCGGEFAGKCHKCLRDLYVWEDSKDDTRATSYTEATARNLGAPGFFIHFDADSNDKLLWLKATMVWPERLTLGDADQFATYLTRLRDAHMVVYHRPRKLIDA